MNLPIKKYIVPLGLLCLGLFSLSRHEEHAVVCAGLNFIALFAALLYGPANAPTLTGKELSFFQYRHDNSLSGIFPIKGAVVKTVTLSGEDDWLLVKLNRAFQHGALNIQHVLLKRSDKQPIIPNRDNQLVHFKLVPDINMLCENGNDKTDFPMEEWALCK